MKTTKIVGSGKYTYEIDENWAKLLDGAVLYCAEALGMV